MHKLQTGVLKLAVSCVSQQVRMGRASTEKNLIKVCTGTLASNRGWNPWDRHFCRGFLFYRKSNVLKQALWDLVKIFYNGNGQLPSRLSVVATIVLYVAFLAQSREFGFDVIKMWASAHSLKRRESRSHLCPNTTASRFRWAQAKECVKIIKPWCTPAVRQEAIKAATVPALSSVHQQGRGHTKPFDQISMERLPLFYPGIHDSLPARAKHKMHLVSLGQTGKGLHSAPAKLFAFLRTYYLVRMPSPISGFFMANL